MSVTTTALLKSWPEVKEYFTVPRNEREYNHLAALLDSLIDNDGDKTLMQTIGLLIEAYEKDRFPIEESDGLAVLKYLIEEHSIKQTDLKEIGGQGVVSEVLSGKRALNVRQVKALSERFNVSPAVFVG